MPSAAGTFKKNFPQAVVYNQCANTMLKYTIKTWEGMDVDRPYELYDEKKLVPPPPKKGSIKVITAGFPCQAHSTLNMFKDVNDVKNNLVLNALSWVDAIRPIYAFFENVKGFLEYRLSATQASAHRVEGGIEMGGLKLMVRALLDMGYQVRFSLLQAAHYGTPQRRIRFFCVAALHGYPLPELPQPSHDYECTTLSVGLPYAVDSKETIRPIRVTPGTALHPTVTIDDAIGDLPRFDWKHPSGRGTNRTEGGKRIDMVECDKNKPSCGLKGPVPPYHYRPKTRFQVEARATPTSNLQQFTKVLDSKRVERVLAIPLEANADYRRLANANQEWQLANPHSYTARNGYKPGAYGRLDKNGVFATIVTNVDPTAKQSRVLNPYCKRIVTVRELARGQGFPDHFVFEAHGERVVTMHRQIGNAVPYPLGRALGRELRASLFKKWLDGRQNAITIDDDDDEDTMVVDKPRRSR
ncbi:hypothetical protein NMY22_g6555 [Coprinellus aureogranulatus]|nr:hypothetical protein NMY22_g6555 [Coprinellus aureogranulatus]